MNEWAAPVEHGSAPQPTSPENRMIDVQPATNDRPIWQNPRVVAAGIGTLIFVIFAAQNSGSVTVDFLFWGFDMSLILLMILCAAVGAAVWELGKYIRRRASL